MRAILFYFYSDRVPLLDSMAIPLFTVADRFQLDDLKRMAGAVSLYIILILLSLFYFKALCNGLSVENACYYLILAHAYNSANLMYAANQFIAQNFSDVKMV